MLIEAGVGLGVLFLVSAVLGLSYSLEKARREVQALRCKYEWMTCGDCEEPWDILKGRCDGCPRMNKGWYRARVAYINELVMVQARRLADELVSNPGAPLKFRLSKRTAHLVLGFKE